AVPQLRAAPAAEPPGQRRRHSAAPLRSGLRRPGQSPDGPRKLNQVSKKKQKKLKTDSTVSHSSSVVEPVMKLATQQQPSKSEKAAATRQELQQKLQARMEQLRQQRNAQPTASGDRGKKRRSLKRKEATLKRRVQNLAAANETQPNQQQQKQQSGSQAKYNKDGKILYSKFDLVAKEELLGSETTGSRAAAETRKRQRKQLERRLVPTTAGADLERQRRRIEAMKSSNPEAAARLEEKARWERAMARAEGVKVKDDPARLARTAKRQAKMRRVKARKWQERQAGVEQRQTERQERRRANIRRAGGASKAQNRARKKEGPNFAGAARQMRMLGASSSGGLSWNTSGRPPPSPWGLHFSPIFIQPRCSASYNNNSKHRSANPLAETHRRFLVSNRKCLVKKK
ncbi:hypothetical protein BOX15_Mlig008570g2, partial [Macrostomum lignano]